MATPGSNSIRIGAYIVVAALMFIARRRERRLVGDADGTWPAFWLMTGGLLITMAAVRAVEVGDVIGAFGRRAAQDGEWYASRRPIQALVIGGLVAGWFVIVIVALWRTPERRRRYLPVGLAILTLVVFAGVRAVSLHQVDSLVYRTDVAGMRVGTLIEIGLLVATGLATRWCPPAGDGGSPFRGRDATHPSDPSGREPSSDRCGASARQRSGGPSSQ